MTTLLPLALLLLAAAPGVWKPIPNAMRDGRWAPAFCLLPDGHTALIVGGYSYAARACVATADRFEERTRRFLPSRSRLTFPRNFATATSLPDGHVLIAGGYNTVLGTLDTAELYDPAQDSFRVLPTHLSVGRELFTATLLTDGRVLLVGGFSTHRRATQTSADLYDPITQSFTPASSTLTEDRFGHAAVRLADGRVLIVGGTHWHVGQPGVTLASAEIFDPQTGLFHRTAGDMATPRDRPTASLLRDGRVLIAGGQNGKDGPQQVEVFDPRTERFETLPVPLIETRMAHADARLPDGRILLAGGWSPARGATTATTELYDPATGALTAGPSMPQSGHDMALLVFPDGLVLVAGGKQVSGGHETALAGGATWQAPSIRP